MVQNCPRPRGSNELMRLPSSDQSHASGGASAPGCPGLPQKYLADQLRRHPAASASGRSRPKGGIRPWVRSDGRMGQRMAAERRTSRHQEKLGSERAGTRLCHSVDRVPWRHEVLRTGRRAWSHSYVPECSGARQVERRSSEQRVVGDTEVVAVRGLIRGLSH
jgi:hypothetical protein